MPGPSAGRAREYRALARHISRYLRKIARISEGMARDRERIRNRRITRLLKVTFGKIEQEPVPEEFRTLLDRLEATEGHRHRRH